MSAMKQIDKTDNKPAFMAMAALMLALFVGANLATFAVIKTVLTGHLPFPTPDQLVTLFDNHEGSQAPRESARFTNAVDVIRNPSSESAI